MNLGPNSNNRKVANAVEEHSNFWGLKTKDFSSWVVKELDARDKEIRRLQYELGMKKEPNVALNGASG